MVLCIVKVPAVVSVVWRIFSLIFGTGWLPPYKKTIVLAEVFCGVHFPLTEFCWEGFFMRWSIFRSGLLIKSGDY